MGFVVLAIILAAASVAVVWSLRKRALVGALTSEPPASRQLLPLRAHAAVLIVHDDILEDIAAAISGTLSAPLDWPNFESDRGGAPHAEHPLRAVLGQAEGWSPSTIASDFDVQRLPGRVEVQDLEAELTRLSGSLGAASRSTTAAASSLRQTDVLLARLPADVEDDMDWHRSLRLHMEMLGFDAVDDRLSSGPSYVRQRDGFPTDVAKAVRGCADRCDEKFAATRSYLQTVFTAPPLTSTVPASLGSMLDELIVSATAFVEKASEFVAKQRVRRGRGAGATEETFPRRPAWLDELQHHVSLAQRKAEEGSVLEALFILDGTPTPRLWWWRRGRHYGTARRRSETRLRQLVAEHGQAIETWATSTAEGWHHAITDYEEWVATEGKALNSTRLSTRAALAESAGALQREVCELLRTASTPGSAAQLQFVASASCAAALSDACVPAWSALLAGSTVERAQLGSDLEDGRKLGRTHRQLERAVAAANRLAGEVVELQPHTGGAAARSFETVLAAAHPPEDVRAEAIPAFGVMHDKGATDAAWSSALALGHWATSLHSSGVAGRPRDRRSQSPTPTAASTGSTALDDLWAPVMSALAEWANHPDPNAERAERLGKFMGTLGLAPDQSTLSATGRYQDARRALAEQASPVVTDFVEAVGSALEEGRSAFLGLAEKLALSVVATGEGAATSALSLFHRDVGRYLLRSAAVLAAPLPTAEAVPALGTTRPAGSAPPMAVSEVARSLAGLESSIAEPDVWSAAFLVSAVPVPVAPGWEPTDEYVAASERIAVVFSELSAQLLASLVAALGDACSRLLAQSRELCRSVEEGFESAAAAQATAWNELESAAQVVQREALEKLLTEPTTQDGSLQVRAALGVHVLDNLARENMSEAIGALIPAGPAVSANADAYADTDAQLQVALERATRYQTASLALAGADGLLLGALASDGFASFSPAVFGLSGVGDNVHSAFNGLLSAAHETNLHHDVVQSALQTLHLDLINLLAPNDVHESLLSLAHGATHGFPFQGSALWDLIGSDFSPVKAAAVLFQNNVEAGALSVLHDVLGTEGGHEAVFHVEHAGRLVGLDVLHGALAHVPIITAVLATAREVRLQREHEIALQSSVANASLDVAFVGGGVLAAVTATGPLHLGPHAVVTIPAAILGGYLGRLGLKHRQRKKLEDLQLECKRLHATFEQQHSAMVQQCAQTVSGGMDRARATFLESAGEAPSMEPVPRPDADPMVRALGAATATYARYIERLLEAVTDGSEDTVSKRPELEELRTSVGIARQTSSVGEELLGDDDWVGAALAISAAPLPVYDAWMPSGGYGRTCQEWAERLTAGSDAQRRATRSWLESALVSFDASKSSLDKQLQEADGVLKREKAAAWAPVEKAAEDFRVELARAGGKH